MEKIISEMKKYGVVFVPMFGDSFFTINCPDIIALGIGVFVPMFGDSFFTKCFAYNIIGVVSVFVPMFGDSFFTTIQKRGEKNETI